MFKCIKCENNFKYKEILNSFCFGYKLIICSKCGCKFKHKIINRILAGLSVAFPGGIPLLLMNNNLKLIGIISYFIIATITILLLPFVLKYYEIE